MGMKRWPTKTAESVGGLEAAVEVCREELGDVEATVDEVRELGRGDSARNQVNLVLKAVVDDGVVIARRNDELSTGLNSALALLEIHDGTGTDEDIGALLGHLTNAIGSSSGAEGHLSGRKTALDQSVGHGNSILNLLQHNDRHNGRLLKLLVKTVLFHVLGRHIDFLSLHVELINKHICRKPRPRH